MNADEYWEKKKGFAEYKLGFLKRTHGDLSYNEVLTLYKECIDTLQYLQGDVAEERFLQSRNDMLSIASQYRILEHENPTYRQHLKPITIIYSFDGQSSTEAEIYIPLHVTEKSFDFRRFITMEIIDLHPNVVGLRNLEFVVA